jgi:molybdopterin converting factor small subunit
MPEPPFPTFTILYFAAASSYTGLESEQLPAPLQLSKLFEKLEVRYDGIFSKVLKGCAITINLEYVDIPVNHDHEILIKAGDEVGIIPPVSSG